MSSSKRRKTGPAASAGRDWTVSVALPGSIIANAQTAELKTYLAGQVARAAVVFNVDEIVVFADRRTPGDRSKSTQGQFQGAVKGASFDADVFLARLLQYLETPQCVFTTAARAARPACADVPEVLCTPGTYGDSCSLSIKTYGTRVC
jgi:hypothetical protein